MKITTNTPQQKRKRLIMIGTAILLVVIAVAAIWYFRHRTVLTDSGSDKGASDVKQTPATSTSNSSGPVKDSSEPGAAPDLDTSTTPAAPSGVFVSNHHPNLSGSPAPNSVSSTCSTTPGATCTIRFVMGSVTKSLPPQTTGSDGNTSWVWTLQEVGLTAGEWSVSAVATNGNLTSSSSDALRLVVAE